MRESILTIPISEIFEPKCGCPICAMRETLEKRTVEYIMGSAMMEPDIRIETNKLGFCREHYTMMLKQKNRLSLALMLQTHLDTVQKEVFSKNIFFSRAKKKKSLEKKKDSCFVCSKVDWAMDRLMVTVFEMYETSEDFRRLFAEQPFICMRDCEELISRAESGMSKRWYPDFAQVCLDLAGKYCSELYKDVSHYCSMYDYRNNGPDADWGNSRDSIERSIKFLTGRDN